MLSSSAYGGGNLDGFHLHGRPFVGDFFFSNHWVRNLFMWWNLVTFVKLHFGEIRWNFIQIIPSIGKIYQNAHALHCIFVSLWLVVWDLLVEGPFKLMLVEVDDESYSPKRENRSAAGKMSFQDDHVEQDVPWSFTKPWISWNVTHQVQFCSSSSS